MRTDPRRLGRRRAGAQRGFTLLEIMVVMVIIGIVVSMVTLSIGVGIEDRTARKEGERLQALVKLASDEAVLEGREIGIVFDTGGYKFSTLSPSGSGWTLLGKDDAPFVPHHFPPDYLVALEIQGDPVPLRAAPVSADPAASPTGSLPPQVQIYSSGDVTGFSLTLRSTTPNGRGMSLQVAESGVAQLAAL